MTTIRLIYMVYDPYCQYNKVSYKYDRIVKTVFIFPLSINLYIEYNSLFYIFD